MSTYIIIPAYNEGKNIASVVSGLLEAGYEHVLVIDDGSQDNTASQARQAGALVVSHVINLGQGAALQTGMDVALAKGAAVAVHFDADGQHRVEDIERFVAKVNEGYDIVLGSRFLDEKSAVPKTKKWLILKPAIWINWLFTGVRLTDAHNGFRAMNRNALEKIRLYQNRMAHATEITGEIARHELKHTEIPVEIIYHEYGQNMLGGVKIIVDLIKQKLFF
jgi:glycosyltransferase involved in cell wall biosynthesis